MFNMSDKSFWDSQVRHPAAAWTARGGRGQLRAPEEEVARTLVPGGIPAVTPAIDTAAESPYKRKRENRKLRAKRGQEDAKGLGEEAMKALA